MVRGWGVIKEERRREKEGDWGEKRGGDGRGLRRERDRQRQRQTDKQTETERQRDRDRERQRQSKVGNDATCKVILT